METNALAPMTELEAINDMLSVIGESPLASLEEVDGVTDAQIAQQILGRENRSVQAQGWSWNTEEDYRLAPDTNGEILLPSNTLSVDPSDGSKDYVYRSPKNDGGQIVPKLYDRLNHTFVISAAVSVTLVLALNFEELPEAARRYVSLRAARKFENRMIGDNQQHQIDEGDALSAKADLMQEECWSTEANVVRDSPSVSRSVLRNRSPNW